MRRSVLGQGEDGQQDKRVGREWDMGPGPSICADPSPFLGSLWQSQIAQIWATV